MAKATKDFWKGRRVLVTGANGFLAGWVVKALLLRGAAVAALVYQKNPVSVFETEGLNRQTEVIYSDILDFPSMKRVLRNHAIQTVFHLGAQAICKVALEDPIATLDANIRGTANIMEAVRVTNPSIEVIAASSDKAYGIHDKLPYRESAPLHGEFPYEVSKSCADLVSRMYFHAYGIPLVIVRSGNLYGGGDAHFSRIFPRTIHRLLRGLRPVVQSEGVRDYLYVEDAARGYIALAERVREFAGEAFNIGCETPLSNKKIIAAIAKALHKPKVRLLFLHKPVEEIPNQYLSCKKIRRAIGWKPLVSLEEGVKRTVAWYREFFRGKNIRSLPLTD
ncbi:MAG: GDP-mannose 4,6-dehydratase [Patescibacteria group bacterium]